jgi:uncharacterized protein
MIIDCHAHIYPDRNYLGQAENFSCFDVESETAPAQPTLDDLADAAFILGFASDLLEADIPNDYLADFARANFGRVIPFAGVDPTRKNCHAQVDALAARNIFAGLTISPACQGFHPADTRAMRFYEQAESLRLPVYFLQGERLPQRAMLLYADPTALDEVARAFPRLTLIISHLGFPRLEQTLALLAKHPNVFADIAGLADKPRHSYQCLSLACELQVADKLLLASDFPRCTISETITAVYNVNKLSADCVMPPLPRDLLRGIIERDTIALLGLQRFKPQKISVGALTEN